MNTQTPIPQFSVQLAALSLLFATIGLADGIPEPGLVMYGSVTNTAGSFGLMSGGVQWTASGAGSSATVASTIANVNGQLVSEALQRMKQAHPGDEEPEDPRDVPAALIERAVFTFTPEGLRLWFDPSEVGSYAEGTYTPVIRCKDIIHLLAPSLAARALPCF